MRNADAIALTAPGTVILIEDDIAVRNSLALLLRLHGYATGEYGSAEDFLAAPQLQSPACALVDIKLPGISGLALQQQMARSGGGIPVLLMTAQGDAAVARTALLQGASDFLEKPIEEGELLAAVRAAMLGGAVQGIKSQQTGDALRNIAALTREERELFEQITNGRKSREIAQSMGIAIDVVDARRDRLMAKLQAPRITDLFRLRFWLSESTTPPCAP